MWLRSASCGGCRCYVDDKVSKVAWLNRSNIIFAGQDKWSLDPRVDLVTKGQLEYSLRIQKVVRSGGVLLRRRMDEELR